MLTWDTIYYKSPLNPTDLHFYQSFLLEDALSSLKMIFVSIGLSQP
jgi:hypothetical protein